MMPCRPAMTFCSMVGHASFQTAEASGPSTIERSNFCKVFPSYLTIETAVLGCSPESRMPDVLRRAVFGASDFVWGPWHTPIGPVPGPLMILLILAGIY